MAACNYKEGSMAKRAITAALVGVLSVGTVPMVALAEGAQAAADAISPMFAEPGGELANGTATVRFEDENGTGVNSYTLDGVTTIDADKLPVIAKVDYVQIAGGGSPIKVEEHKASDYNFRVYRADADGNATGNPLAGEKITSAGN